MLPVPFFVVTKKRIKDMFPYFPTFFLEKKGGKVNREAQNLLLPNDYNRVFAVLTFCYFGTRQKEREVVFLLPFFIFATKLFTIYSVAVVCDLLCRQQ